MTSLQTKNPIHVVLVRSIYSRNVGSVSRAMANLGASRLILVDPKCDLDFEARQGAAGAQSRLIEATVYNTWADFYASEGEGVRIAFCAKSKIETDALDIESRAQEILKTHNGPIYLIFGPEDHGLSNDDVSFANFICQLPVYGDFTSFNLSHAVLLATYIFQKQLQLKAPEAEVTPVSKFEFPDATLQKWLNTLGFEVGDRRIDAYKVLKRILLKNIATDKELRILEAVIFQTIRKLPENHRDT
jgi:tRNA/rRNA methyltransferase